jgi:hypothetical protein
MTTLATSKNLTILGILAIVQALAVAAVAVFDGDPTTNVNIGLLISSVVAGVGMILAKGAQSTGGTVDGSGKPVP